MSKSNYENYCKILSIHNMDASRIIVADPKNDDILEPSEYKVKKLDLTNLKKSDIYEPNVI